MEKEIKELIELAHKMANKIKISHGGWYESYASEDELELISLSDHFKKKETK